MQQSSQSSVAFPRSRVESMRMGGVGGDVHSWRDSFASGRAMSFTGTINNGPNRESSLEVFDLVYGPGSLSDSRTHVMSALERLYEPHAIYENPFITATSREVIMDCHNLTRVVSDIDVPRPRALLATLFGRRGDREEDKWFEALKCWSEIGDIAESEGWDGTRKSIIEHTLHILILPGIHVPSTSKQPLSPGPTSASGSTLDLQLSTKPSSGYLHKLTYPRLPLIGLNIPSPFHLKLRIITKLTFNEQGRVLHHRDWWDIRDLISLIPGAQPAQWILTRVAARGLSSAMRVGSWLLGGSGGGGRSVPEEEEVAEFRSRRRSVSASDPNMLGLDGLPPYGRRSSRAPDTDPYANI